MTPASPHNDPALWAFFNEIAERADELRRMVAACSTGPEFPDNLKVRATSLTYHLHQAHNEAWKLAGPEPKR
jgi:hypothetical protein